ncbi:MAG: thiamine phosphate synthase [Ardenticatenales bacterium]
MTRAPRPLPEPPLLVITDRRASLRPLDDVVAAALAGGCRWFVVREKDLSADGQAAIAAAIAAQAAPFGATVLVAGPAEFAIPVARAAGAAGVHLPRHAGAGDVAAVRSALGADILVGQSAHDHGEAERAGAAGADYATLSPIFGSASKPGYGPAIGLGGLADVARAVAVPIVALGGIESGGAAAACRTAGAAGVAVMGAVARTGDPRGLVAALVDGAG